MPGNGTRRAITRPDVSKGASAAALTSQGWAPQSWSARYRLRLKRRRLMWRCLRARHQLTPCADRTSDIRAQDILLVAVLRNEITRLPHFLQYYRDLGVSHFLIVDNGSTDGSTAFLAAQPDVSLWETKASYRDSRFGVDWAGWLLMRYGHGHWCLTVDADEILTYPHVDQRSLHELTTWLDQQGQRAFGAMMLDMYPKGAIGAVPYVAGTDPFVQLNWFDAQGYTWERQARYRNISIRGGARKRVFFAQEPEHAPHLHKVPLVRWDRRFAYVSSTHVALPQSLNRVFDARSRLPSGVLLHSKFLDGVIAKSAEEKQRRQHFTHADRYDAYYDSVIADPDLWSADSVRYRDWQQLEALGLMTRGDWV